MKDKAIDIANDLAHDEWVAEHEACGLAYTGDSKFPWIGDNKAWAKYDNGDY